MKSINISPPFYMVFDVESVGLHGEGFAVGFVVVGNYGEVYSSFEYCAPPASAAGILAGHEWIKQNIPPLEATHDTPAEVRKAFWEAWKYWRSKGAVLVADCGWPVEARFLAQCVDDAGPLRAWEGPYPLHDLASVMLAKGHDPLATRERLSNELPAHSPLADARQSARLLIACLQNDWSAQLHENP